MIGRIQSVSANLTGLALGERPAWFASLAARLADLRARTGRPHWLVVDEAHHVLGASREPALVPPLPERGTIFITVEPSHVTLPVLSTMRALVALGRHPMESLSGFAAAIGEEPPRCAGLSEDGAERPDGLFWLRDEPEARRFEAWPSETERRRHRRKYAEGDFGPNSFYFRGPEGALNLRAQNLQVFAELAQGVDEATWLYHLRRGDIAQWMADCVKDAELAAEIAAIAADDDSARAGRKGTGHRGNHGPVHGARVTAFAGRDSADPSWVPAHPGRGGDGRWVNGAATQLRAVSWLELKRVPEGQLKRPWPGLVDGLRARDPAERTRGDVQICGNVEVLDVEQIRERHLEPHARRGRQPPPPCPGSSRTRWCRDRSAMPTPALPKRPMLSAGCTKAAASN